MTTTGKGRGGWIPVMLGALAMSTLAGVPAASAAGAGVCTGVAGCRVMAFGDVNGDGNRDAIGMVRHGANGAAEGSVIVRVKIRPGVIASAYTKTGYWYGSPWQGVATLDGRRGKEIVVGRTAGAHTQFYRALTWRQGGLTTLGAPGKGTDWIVDGAMRISIGWNHKRTDKAGTIRRRWAERTGDAVHSRFKGTVTTYRWTSTGWTKTASKTIYPMRDATAYSWGGFQVPGLYRW